MPTYPYACTACDHRFEQVQAFSDPSLTECPECGGRLRKVFSSVGIVFKGSGWYRNDSRSGSSGSSSASSSEKSDSSDGGSSEKADKPAATKTESTGEKPAAAKTEKSGAASGSSSSGTGSTAASSA